MFLLPACYGKMVPCHRVIASDRSLGGFSGATDPASKQLCEKVDLLTKEGVILLSSKGKTMVCCAECTEVERDRDREAEKSRETETCNTTQRTHTCFVL